MDDEQLQTAINGVHDESLRAILQALLDKLNTSRARRTNS